MTKVFWSELDVDLHQTALDLRGPDAELADSWTDGLLFALGGPTIPAPTRFSAISSPNAC